VSDCFTVSKDVLYFLNLLYLAMCTHWLRGKLSSGEQKSFTFFHSLDSGLMRTKACLEAAGAAGAAAAAAAHTS
jgi:hypothetical protein